MNRKAKLEKALAPSLPNDTIRLSDMAWGIQCHGHAQRLEPLRVALIEAVCMLELLGCEKAKLGNSFTRYKSRKALAKIDDVLDGFQPCPNYKPEREESGT